MSTIRRRARVPARWHMLACCLLLAAGCSVAAAADGGIVDVHKLPQLEGAVEDTTRPDPFRVEYRVPTPVSVTSQNVRALLSAQGWVPYVLPLDEKSGILKFKKGRQGLSVHFSQAVGRPDQSIVYYASERIYSDVPFPDGGSDILFDGTRPYLSAIAAGALEPTSTFYADQMTALGWRKLTPETAARWTTTGLDESMTNGVRAFYDHPEGDTTQFYKQKPVMLTLMRRDDGRTQVEIRIAPFALPAELQAGEDVAGLPRPNPTKTASGTGSATSNKREMKAAVLADLPAVLGFYKRELAARGWREEGSAPLGAGDEVAIKVSAAEETGVLRLGRRYDVTMVSLATQLTEAGLAARAKAKKEADEKFFRDAGALAGQIIAADEARRKEQAAALSDAPLKALADSATPLPLPDTAEGVKFDGNDGRLEFTSTSSVKAIGAFYRTTLKPAGWTEQPSVINQPNMAVLQFSRNGKSVSMTVMQMGPKVNVSASGAALKLATATPATKPDEQTRSAEPLKPDPQAQLPLPMQRSSTSLSTMKLPGNETPFRRELEASVPAPLADVLAFYRGELSNLGWQEKAEGAAVAADRVRIDFVSPQGPAVLKLGRVKGETLVSLAQKNPEAAIKAEIMPKPGQARLMLGNLGPQEAVITINKQTVKVAAGTGSPQSPKGPMLDLPPGSYQVSLKVGGGPARTESLTVAAGDAWGLMVGPGGDALPLQMY